MIEKVEDEKGDEDEDSDIDGMGDAGMKYINYKACIYDYF